MPKAIISGAGGVLTEIEIEEQTEPVEYRPLEPYQFHAMLKLAGHEGAVKSAIAAMPDETARAVAEAKLERTGEFNREDKLVIDLSTAIGLTPAELDKMWLKAAKF